MHRHHDAEMRTTLTLEDNLAAKLREAARKRKLSFKQIVNEALRKGLQAAGDRRKVRNFRVEPIMRGGFQPGIDMDKINQFLDEEETEQFIGKRKGGK
jgi:hypothetical protein